MTLRAERDAFTRAYLFRVLSQTGGQMKKAAAIAGVHRQTFYKLLEKHGLKVEHRRYVHQEIGSKFEVVAPQSCWII